MDEGYNPFPFPQQNNPFNDQAKESGAKMQSELRDTLRSFRDSLAFSFQTLNLTLASLNNSVRTVGIKISQLNTPASMQYVPPTHPLSNAYYGSMSRSYADFMGNRGMLGVFTADQPYNVNPLEFWREKQGEEATRLGGAASAFTTAVGEELLTYGAGIAGGNALARVFGMGGSTLAKFAFGAPAAMLASQVIGAYAQPFVASAQEHSRDVAAVRRMSGRFSTPFTIAQSQDVMRGIERLAYQETLNTNRLEPRLSMSGFRDITMMGLQADMFKGTTPEELVQQVASASQVVKFLTGVLGNKDVRETMETVKQLKNMGINLFKNPGVANMLGNDAFGFGRVMGVDSATMMGMAANMSTAAFGQFGNPAAIGIQPAMRNLAYLSELEKRGILSSAEMNAAGGVQAVGARMLDMQARLLNNPNVGGALLMSGWDGNKGFNMDQFRANAANGYIGTLGSAARNFISGGIGGMATFLMNQENIMSDLAQQGNIGEVLDAMLASKLNMLPGINSMTPDEAVNYAAMFLRDTYGVDSATAKASAIRVLRPSTGKAVERQRNREIQLSTMELARAQHAPTRFFESIGEGWERLKSSAYETLIRRPAVAMSDAWINLADDTYESRDIIPQEMITLDHIYGLKNRNRSNYRLSKDGQPTTKEIEQAYRNLERTDTLGYSIDRFFNMTLGPNGIRKNTLDDIVYANALNYNADFWKNQITPGKKLSTANVVAELVQSGLFGSNVNSRRFNEYFEDNYNASNSNEIFRVASDYIVENLSASGRKSMDRAIRSASESLAMRGLDLDALFKDLSSTTSDGKAFTDANSAYTAAIQSENRNKVLAYMAKKGINDMSVEQVVGLMVNKAFKGKISNDAYVEAAGQHALKYDVASAGDTGENAAMFARGDQKAGLIDLTRNLDLKLLKDLNIDRTDMSILNKASAEDTDAFIDYVVNHAYNFGKEDTAALAKIKSKDLQNLAAKVVGNSTYGLSNRRVLSNSIGLKDRVANEAFGTTATNTDQLNSIKGTLAGAISHGNTATVQDNLMATLRDLGFNTEGKDATEFLDIIKGTTTTQEGRRIQRNIDAFASKALSDQANILKNMLSKADFEKLVGENGILDADNPNEVRKAQEQYALILAQSGAVDTKVESKNKQANVVKSAVDSAVDTTGHGLPYVRIKNVDAAINKAQEDLYRNKYGVASTTPKSESFTNWDFFVPKKNT